MTDRQCTQERTEEELGPLADRREKPSHPCGGAGSHCSWLSSLRALFPPGLPSAVKHGLLRTPAGFKIRGSHFLSRTSVESFVSGPSSCISGSNGNHYSLSYRVIQFSSSRSLLPPSHLLFLVCGGCSHFERMICVPQKAVVMWTLLRKVPMEGRKGSCTQLVINAPKCSHAQVSSRDVAHWVEIQPTLCQPRPVPGSPPAQEIMAGLSFVSKTQVVHGSCGLLVTVRYRKSLLSLQLRL